MKVNKFKKLSGGKYKVYFDNTEMVLYEEVILKYELLFDKDIDIYMIDKISNENKYYEAYHMALKYIEIKMRSRNELYEYLIRKDFDLDMIDRVLCDIDSLGIINDEVYIESYINDKVNLSNNGPDKIKDELVRMGFDEGKINNYLSNISDDIWREKIEKYISKKLKSNNKSYYMFINKLKYELISLGYDRYMIEEELSKIEYFSGDLSKDYDKFNKKYEGDKYKISNGLHRKGYSYDEINEFLNNL